MAIENYFLPQSLEEAVGLLAEHDLSLLVMAGGTIAMPLINDGISLPKQVMGLRQAGLSYREPHKRHRVDRRHDHADPVVGP